MKTKPSMVAMSGAIMPEPLQIPLRATAPLADLMTVLRVASFGKVSVVMMASAAAGQAPASRSPDRPARAPVDGRSVGRGSPITPVEATKTSCRPGSPRAGPPRPRSLRPWPRQGRR